MVHAAQTRDPARDDLIDRWDRDRQASPDRDAMFETQELQEARRAFEEVRPYGSHDAEACP